MTKNQEIAGTILNQLGGNRFVVMTGAKKIFAVENGLQFDLPRTAHYVKDGINRITITLDTMDTYTMKAGKMTRRKDKNYGVMMPHYIEVKKEEGLYDDMLQERFKAITGLDTHL